MKEFFQNYIVEGLMAIIGVVGGWLVGRTKSNADTSAVLAVNKSLEANAIEAMQRAYDIYIEHNNRKLADFEKEIVKLKEEQESVEKKWKQKYENMSSELAALEKYWQTKYANLKKEFDIYKKSNGNN